MSYIMMLGRLATDEELGGYKEQVYTSYRGATCMIKPLSEQPEAWDTNSYYSCTVSFLDSGLSSKDDYDIKEGLKNKFIAFRPYRKPDNGFYKYIAYDPIYATPMDVSYAQKAKFVPVPFFNLDKLELTFEAFESKLVKGEAIVCDPCISRDVRDTPRLIMAYKANNDNDGVDVYLYGGYDKINYGEGILSFVGNDIKKARFENDIDGKYLVESDEKHDIVFMSIEGEIKYTSKLDSFVVKDGVTYSLNDVNKDLAESLKGLIKEESPVKEDTPVKENISVKKDTPDKEVATSNGFINEVQRVMEKEELIYDLKDFVKFDIAAKTSSIVILSGMSGTGKSKLVKVYSEALAINEYNGLKFIPVSPSWTDDADLLGYVDYQSNLYREADTELVSFLKEASEHKDKKYIVCFDEMNLAKVEHYFSQFISILENEVGEKTLNVYNAALESKLYNSNLYPSKIDIGSNVIFVGTVNIDESTLILSDKVLDRASVIKLNTQSFDNLKKVIKDFYLTDREVDFFEKLNEVLSSQNPRMGIGYRIVSQANKYVGACAKDNILSRSEAIDSLVAQRIITKLRGSDEQIGSLVGKVSSNRGIENSFVIDLFNEYADVSDFNASRHEIGIKAKELKSYGYTI